MYIYHVDEISDVNSNLIANVRTTKIVPRGIFSLNNFVLFRLNMLCVALSAVLTFAIKYEFSFEPAPYHVYIYI